METKKILVVDNNTVILKLMTTFLAHEGHEVVGVEDAFDALDVLREFTPQIIYLDLVMPKIGGDSLCKILRTLPLLTDCYIAIVSAAAVEQSIDFLEIGADACIAKGPFSTMRHHILETIAESDAPRHVAARLKIRGIETLHSRQITKELLSQNQHLQIILESMSQGILAIADNRVFYANPAALFLLQVTMEYLLGAYLDRILEPPVWEKLAPLIEAGADIPIEANNTVLKICDRYIIPQCLTIQEDRRNQVVLLTDITDRKRSEEELKNSLSLLRASLESTADGILIVDRQGKIAQWNQKFAEMWKIPDEVLSSHDDTKAINYILTQLRDPEQFTNKVRELYEQPEQSSFDQIEFADGRVFERYSQPQRIEDNIVGRVWSFRDITARKQAEEDRKKIEDQFRQAQKMELVGQLAGGVAHDFNNMLGVILGHTEMAMEQVDPAEPLFADLEEILGAANRSADIIRQLLAFARKQTVIPKAVDLNETVEKMLKMLRRLVGEDIDLVWIPGVELWPVKVDPAQIDQILANLCVNARDAVAGVGKITVETGNSILEEEYCHIRSGFIPGEYVRIAVSDNGHGMDKGTLSHIFEPFFTTKDLGKGSGLGLATVYGAVKQNNGFINAYSEPGQGTTFTIYLPRHVGKANQTFNEEHAKESAVRGHETILLVEDEPANLKITMKMLESFGYTVLAAGTPGEAIRLAIDFANEIRLLLTDVIMPEMTGRDLVERLLAIQPGIKHLFMSGYTADVISHHGVLDEGGCFIQKPFSKKELADTIRSVLEN